MGCLSAGSAAATALKFIRFALIVNSLQLLVWLTLVVLPFLVSPPSTFSWSVFKTTKVGYLLQGQGLGSTFLLYGETLATPKSNRAQSQKGLQ